MPWLHPMRRHRHLMMVLIAAALGGCGAMGIGGDDAAPAPRDGPAVPVERLNVVAAVRALPEMAMTTRALADTGMADRIIAMPGVTMLAPRDSAYMQIPTGQRSALFAPAHRAALAEALSALLIARPLRAEELRTQIDAAGGVLSLTTVSGGSVMLSRTGDLLILRTTTGAQATLGSEGIATRHGIVYILDKWVGPIPAAMATPAAPPAPVPSPLPAPVTPTVNRI